MTTLPETTATSIAFGLPIYVTATCSGGGQGAEEGRTSAAQLGGGC
jgi:hypothetical protein